MAQSAKSDGCIAGLPSPRPISALVYGPSNPGVRGDSLGEGTYQCRNDVQRMTKRLTTTLPTRHANDQVRAPTVRGV